MSVGGWNDDCAGEGVKRGGVARAQAVCRFSMAEIRPIRPLANLGDSAFSAAPFFFVDQHDYTPTKTRVAWHSSLVELSSSCIPLGRRANCRIEPPAAGKRNAGVDDAARATVSHAYTRSSNEWWIHESLHGQWRNLATPYGQDH